MQIKQCAAVMANCVGEVYERIFHKRNIIIVSERKVKHLPISGGLQCAIVLVSVTAICWASYSTGNYYAVHHAYKEQSLALKSVVGNKVDSSFSVLGAEERMTPTTSTKAALSTVDSSALFARIADLETKLKASEESKKDFIEKVEQKTSKNIDSFENMIEQTGLDVDSLKGQASASKPSDGKMADRQGGPFIPDNINDLNTRESEVISKLDELSVLKQIVSNLPVRKPIYGYQEMSPFGRRIDPFTGTLAFHAGVDLAGPVDSKIYATADGTVSFSGRSGAYGNLVILDHGFDVSTRYGHLSQILVEDGQTIKRGQIIGVQGTTGRSTGPHLHYEVRYKNQPMDPRNFLLAGRYVQQKS